MANIVNLDGESEASIIGDDSSAALILDNSSTSGTNAYALSVRKRATSGNASQAPVEFVASANASSPAFEVSRSGFVSLTSIVFTSAAHFDYAIRVYINGAERWIPCVKDSGISGGAAYTDNS